MALNVIFLFIFLTFMFRSANSVFASDHNKKNPNTFTQFKEMNKNFNISEEILELAFLDAPDLITRFGYPVEVHKVKTPDGYILELHRIPQGRKSWNSEKKGKEKSVVFLMHGLTSSSTDFLVLGPDHALPLLLADNGYDVWLGNARGNYYSKNHITLDPTASEFWYFTWDEIGNIDLPAFINYILKQTGQKKIHYVGHSQGGTTFLVLTSLRPEYNEKFKSFHGLAPSSYFTQNPNLLLWSLAQFGPIFQKNVELLGAYEALNIKQGHKIFSSMLCGSAPINHPDCLHKLQKNIVELANLNTTMLPIFLSNMPAGGSIMQVLHFAQNIRYDSFARYDFNKKINLLKYGSAQPPEYKIANVKTPTFLYYGLKDTMVYWQDVLTLARKLPNVRQVVEVGAKNFNHFDFLFRSDVKILLYDTVIKNIKRMD